VGKHKEERGAASRVPKKLRRKKGPALLLEKGTSIPTEGELTRSEGKEEHFRKSKLPTRKKKRKGGVHRGTEKAAKTKRPLSQK